MHSQSQYTLSTPLPKHIVYFKQLAEDLRNILHPWATQENLELNPPLHSLDSHQKQKDEILD